MNNKQQETFNQVMAEFAESMSDYIQAVQDFASEASHNLPDDVIINQNFNVSEGFLQQILNNFKTEVNTHEQENTVEEETVESGETNVWGVDRGKLRFVKIYETKKAIAEKLGIDDPDGIIITDVENTGSGLEYTVVIDSGVTVKTQIEVAEVTENADNVRRQQLEVDEKQVALDYLNKVLSDALNHKDILLIAYGDIIQDDSVSSWHPSKVEFTTVRKDISALRRAISVIENP